MSKPLKSIIFPYVGYLNQACLPPFCEESPTRIFAGVEAKYFYASNLNNTKYHTWIGQLVEYLKWGLDIATLVHIFDSDIGETKINEFIKPAFRLISVLRDACHLPLGYICFNRR